MSRQVIDVSELQKHGLSDGLIRRYKKSFISQKHVRAIDYMVTHRTCALTLEAAVVAVYGFTDALAYALYSLYEFGVRAEDLRSCGSTFECKHIYQIADKLRDPNNTLTPEAVVALIRDSLGEIAPLEQPEPLPEVNLLKEEDLCQINQSFEKSEDFSDVTGWLKDLPTFFSSIRETACSSTNFLDELESVASDKVECPEVSL